MRPMWSTEDMSWSSSVQQWWLSTAHRWLRVQSKEHCCRPHRGAWLWRFRHHRGPSDVSRPKRSQDALSEVGQRALNAPRHSLTHPTGGGRLPALPLQCRTRHGPSAPFNRSSEDCQSRLTRPLMSRNRGCGSVWRCWAPRLAPEELQRPRFRHTPSGHFSYGGSINRPGRSSQVPPPDSRPGRFGPVEQVPPPRSHSLQHAPSFQGPEVPRSGANPWPPLWDRLRYRPARRQAFPATALTAV